MQRHWNAVLFVFLLVQLSAGQGGSPQSNPCAAKEQHQLDFWVGEWDLTWPGKAAGTVQHGTNSVHRILDNCVVEENFSGGTDAPLRGKSVSIFDASAGRWKQTWVDNEASYLDFAGEFNDGSMILSREAVGADGTRSWQRMVYKNISSNEFDWSWEASKDGGRSWQVVWPIHYRRRK